MIKFFKLIGLIILLVTVVSVGNIYAKTKVPNTANEINKVYTDRYQKYLKNIPTFLSNSDQMILNFSINSNISKWNHRSATSTNVGIDASDALLIQKMNALEVISKFKSIPGNDSLDVASSTLSELIFATSSKDFQSVYKKVLTSMRQEVMAKSQANQKQSSVAQSKINKVTTKTNTGRSNRVINEVVKDEVPLVATTTIIVATSTIEISTTTPSVEIDNNSTTTDPLITQ